MCRSADPAGQAGVLNLEVHVQTVQLLAAHGAENVLDHLQINFALLIRL